MSESIFTRRKKSRIWIIVTLLLVPVYLFLFPRPAGRETIVKPVWVLDLRRALPEGGGQGVEVFPFRAGARFGYAGVDGRLLYSGLVRHQVALSARGFINYGSRPEHVVFMDPGGEFQFSVQTFGYPLLEEGGEVLYSVNTDLGGLKRLGPDGEVLWQGEFSSPVTSVALRGEECLIGLLDGRAALYGPGGELLTRLDPAGSRISVILGTALSDGGGLAVVSGIDPQRLVLAEGQRYESVRTVELSSDFRREVAMRFSPGGRFLYVEQEDGLLVLESARDRVSRLPLSGRLKSLAVGREFAVAAAGDSSRSRLTVFRPLAAPVAVASLPGGGAWSRVSGRSVFVGLEDELLRADLVEE
jgi:hypothetical protein